MRKHILANGQIYHVFNRGVERRILFKNTRDYKRAVQTLAYYRFANLQVKFSKFLIQPSEKQLLLQEQYNKPENKSVKIIAYCLMPNHFHLLFHLSRYIHLNPVVSFLTKQTDIETYPWSSLEEYLDKNPAGMCDKELVLDTFTKTNSYRNFVPGQVVYAQTLEK